MKGRRSRQLEGIGKRTEDATEISLTLKVETKEKTPYFEMKMRNIVEMRQ